MLFHTDRFQRGRHTEWLRTTLASVFNGDALSPLCDENSHKAAASTFILAVMGQAETDWYQSRF